MGGMKDKERFSAGLVSKPFWFYEYKTYDYFLLGTL